MLHFVSNICNRQKRPEPKKNETASEREWENNRKTKTKSGKYSQIHRHLSVEREQQQKN